LAQACDWQPSVVMLSPGKARSPLGGWLSTICAGDVRYRPDDDSAQKPIVQAGASSLEAAPSKLALVIDDAINGGDSGDAHEGPASPGHAAPSEPEQATRLDVEKVLRGVEDCSNAFLHFAQEHERTLAALRDSLAQQADSSAECLPGPVQRSFTNEKAPIQPNGSLMPAVLPAWEIKLKHSDSLPLLHSNSMKWQDRVGRPPPGQDREIRGRAYAWVISPSSIKKMCWDFLSVLIIGYDLLVLPLSVFSYDDLPGVHYVTLLCTLFWSMDLIVSCFSGYHTKEGVAEMRLHLTVRRYLRTWFPLDLTMVSLDWVLFLVGNKSEEMVSIMRQNRVARFARIMRLVRFTRLIRAVKLVALFQDFSQFVFQAHFITFLNILRLLLLLAIVVHYIACAWCALGWMTYESQESWISPWMDRGVSYSYMYLIAFHWAMAQFLPAPAVEHPGNPHERFFTVLVLFAGFMIFSSTLGSVTALITHARQVAFRQLKESHTLRKFFEQNMVSPSVARQVLHFQASSKQPVKCTPAKAVPLLQLLPAGLKEECLYEVYMGTLSSYPVMDELDESWRSIVKELCVVTIADSVVVKDDIPFKNGAPASCMRFVRMGRLAYYPKVYSQCSQTSSFMTDYASVPRKVKSRSKCRCCAAFVCSKQSATRGAEREVDSKGTLMWEVSSCDSYLSEGALWTTWTHRGTAMARETTMIVQINAEPFAAVAREDPEVYQYCQRYASIFRSRLSRDSDDLFQAFACKEDLQDFWSNAAAP